MDKKIKFALRALAFSACLFMVSCDEGEKKAEEAPKTEENAAPPASTAAPEVKDSMTPAAPAAEGGMDTGNTKPTETNVRK